MYCRVAKSDPAAGVGQFRHSRSARQTSLRSKALPIPAHQFTRFKGRGQKGRDGRFPSKQIVLRQVFNHVPEVRRTNSGIGWDIRSPILKDSSSLIGSQNLRGHYGA